MFLAIRKLSREQVMSNNIQEENRTETIFARCEIDENLFSGSSLLSALFFDYRNYISISKIILRNMTKLVLFFKR